MFKEYTLFEKLRKKINFKTLSIVLLILTMLLSTNILVEIVADPQPPIPPGPDPGLIIRKLVSKLIIT